MRIQIKKNFNLATSKCITYLVNGIGWLMFGLLSVIDNTVCSLLSAIFLFLCIALSTINPFRSKDSDDEMSDHHMIKAKSLTLDFLKIIILSILLILAILGVMHEFIPVIAENVNISLTLIISLILGITEIMTGLFFVKFEKDGE